MRKIESGTNINNKLKSVANVLLEMHANEVAKYGFDKMWDDIRAAYPVEDYDIDEIREIHNGKIIVVSLRNKKYIHLLEEEC